ncbi:acetylglutamate kinase [Bacillus lacus]|uniref:Acetylglutamate kinase n=1 Tax=Metabacillus lacus TaxID=1983721 RepID=A0A7X2M071_9BACI|nr:acetylglutamate kinase [Metabacillus lacus]MRX72469.1 acetylglutamate kinase [Metabacillus lacus]
MKYLIIKCGGSVFERLPESFYKSIVELNAGGKWQPVLVHGGGPLISSMLKKLEIPTEFVNGLRVTSSQVMEVVEMVLSGSVNKQAVGRLMKAGGSAYGVSGADGRLLLAKASQEAGGLGLVGEVVEVNTKLIEAIVKTGNIPVISPVGVDENGQRYNVNGDTAASAIAGALKGRLCFISDISGIYTEGNTGKRKLSSLTKEDAETLIEQKIITGGMIPKVKAAIDGLMHKVPETVILNGLEENSLLDFCEGKEIGTKIILGGEVKQHA